MIWWLNETPPTYYQTNLDGEYVGEGLADPSPLEPGEWLLPGGATWKKPPRLKANQAAVFDGSKWKAVPDHRGEVRWYKGEFMVVSSLGKPPVPAPVVHDAQYILPDNDDPGGARIRMWIDEDVIEFEDNPDLLPRQVLAAWEAHGETIRPVDEPDLEPEPVETVLSDEERLRRVAEVLATLPDISEEQGK